MRSWFRTLAVSAAVLASACLAPVRPPTPPSPPSVPQRTIAVGLSPAVSNAHVVLTLDGKTFDGVTNAQGYMAWQPVPDCPAAHAYSIHVDALPGYLATDSAVLTDCHNHQVNLTLTPAHLDAGERGELTLTGTQWRSPDGGWRWQGCSDFALFQKFLQGENLDAVLDNRVQHHCKVLRVFGQYVGTPGNPSDQGIGVNSGLGHLDPKLASDLYYPQLSAFADLLASRGLRLEYVALADNQVLETDAHAHVQRASAALAGHWNVAGIELCNEPFKNGCDPNDTGLIALVHAAGLKVATGNYDVPWDGSASFLVADYVTWHGDRGDEWPRGPRGLGEIRDGASNYAGAHVAVIADEPMGGAEVDQPGRRSAIATDFRFFGGLTALFGAGGTFHSDDGIGSTLFGPVTGQLADAFFDGLTWAPWSAQFAPYQRGDPGSAEGIGNMPLLHHDLNTGFPDEALRTFCKQADGYEWCVAVRPSAGWHATPLRGCTVVDEPWRGFVKLSCPSTSKETPQ